MTGPADPASAPLLTCVPQAVPGAQVKVDRSFVQGVAESLVDSAIVRAIIDLANAMGISVVAEGVETKDQVAGLKMLGCQIAQGFYFSHPLRADAFDQLLTRHFAPIADLPARRVHQ